MVTASCGWPRRSTSRPNPSHPPAITTPCISSLMLARRHLPTTYRADVKLRPLVLQARAIRQVCSCCARVEASQRPCARQPWPPRHTSLTASKDARSPHSPPPASLTLLRPPESQSDSGRDRHQVMEWRRRGSSYAEAAICPLIASISTALYS